MSDPTQHSPAEALYERLRKLQEPKGYFFNKDRDMTLALLDSLLANKARYGFMACPCRLSCGDYELDKDIVCPCAYRGPDVEEYGSCFCGLYVTREWNEGATDRETVPERRPVDKVLAGLCKP
jgi:ferredoxin-thioredoxin reductase catalytic subunit